MIQPPPQYPIDMLDQRKVPLIQRIFLGLVPIIKRNLLAIINQSRMLKPKLALKSCFFCHIFPKGRC